MKLIEKLLDKDLKDVPEEDLVKILKSQRNWFFLMVLILILVLISLSAGLIIIFDYSQSTTESALDDYFTAQYETVYYPIGKERINAIINETQDISDPVERLTAIADWEIDGFVNCLQYSRWNESYGGTKPLGSKYVSDDEGRVRVMKGEYVNNPYWIAYHKMGACGELGGLFAETAKQAGFEVRNVGAVYVKGGNHVWVEVKVNGEWMYFDPTIYWDNHNNVWGDILNNKWYGTLDEQIVWGVPAIGIFDDNGTDISERYPNVKVLKGVDLVLYKIEVLISTILPHKSS